MGPLSNEMPKFKTYWWASSTSNPVGSITISNEKVWHEIKPESMQPTLSYQILFKPKKIIYNDKATIVFWKDGTKTIVKIAEGTTYSKYNAFCAALAKKIFGTNSAVNRTVANGIEQK